MYIVTADFGRLYQVENEIESLDVTSQASIRPCVGDRVILQDGIITEVLERTNELKRKTAGTEFSEQVVASNFDVLLYLHPIIKKLKPANLERFQLAATTTGVPFYVVITKADLEAESQRWLDKRKLEFPKQEFLLISSLSGEGLKEFMETIGHGKTALLIGSSGAGKSSLVNAFKENAQKVSAVSRDPLKGRHTTTSRCLIKTPLISFIDVPGMREFGLTSDPLKEDNIYSDIEELTASCRYSNCTHTRENGCRVRQAIENNELDEKRFLRYQKFLKEMKLFEKKQKERKQKMR